MQAATVAQSAFIPQLNHVPEGLAPADRLARAYREHERILVETSKPPYWAILLGAVGGLWLARSVLGSSKRGD